MYGSCDILRFSRDQTFYLVYYKGITSILIATSMPHHISFNNSPRKLHMFADRSQLGRHCRVVSVAWPDSMIGWVIRKVYYTCT